MPVVAANLTMLFTDVPFLDRFAAAKQAGFKYVEFLFPYDHPAEKVRDMLDRNGLQVVLFNLPSGNWAGGDRGIGASPNRVEEFRAGVKTAVSYAKVLGAPRLNCLAGKMVPGHSREEHRQTLVEGVRLAADALGEIGVKLVVESINHYDVPGFFLNRTQEALDVLAEAGRPNAYVQYDVYHAQREEGNLSQTLRDHFSKIDHIQVADNPGRHQPGTGEINYSFLFAELDKLGYKGYVGCEYVPQPDTLKSLDWIKEYACQLA
ncbi:MAG TPA: hydroxypyruvate isomerase [Candidatus Methylomirabilis sp.]|nr:hydroxypyruvate isomerase [Candidatus Methylomirabilis sp.]HSC70804.1 hydroxypyruvate isomerase [Candidatus Methylomirabilis sp.]